MIFDILLARQWSFADAGNFPDGKFHENDPTLDWSNDKNEGCRPY